MVTMRKRGIVRERMINTVHAERAAGYAVDQLLSLCTS